MEGACGIFQDAMIAVFERKKAEKRSTRLPDFM
jgi:hypothetical protein